MQQDFSCNGMIRLPYLLEMHKRIDRGKESSVQPSSSLGYKLWDSICIKADSAEPSNKDVDEPTRYICLPRRVVDILKHPSLISFSDQFPAKNSVLGKIHVRSKYIGILAV